jgi:hypothetical protein
MLNQKSVREAILTVALLAGAAGPLAALTTTESCTQRDTPNEIYPGDPRWSSANNVYNLGAVGITANNPQSGNGSLELSTTGSLFDWAFFKRIADGNGAFGLLGGINCVSMDWYRNPYTLPESPPANLTAETWQEQTPVLRLLVRDQQVLSQLVWEGWYNSRTTVSPTVNGQWNFENMTGQQFWRHYEGGLQYDNGGCSSASFVNSSMLQTYDLDGWVTNCYSASAEVYGVMIGLGSYWPGEYNAFLDNVQLGFNGQEGFAIEDNFEFDGPTTATPEPASMILMATGLAGLGAMTMLRKRRAAARTL